MGEGWGDPECVSLGEARDLDSMQNLQFFKYWPQVLIL